MLRVPRCWASRREGSPCSIDRGAGSEGLPGDLISTGCSCPNSSFALCTFGSAAPANAASQNCFAFWGTQIKCSSLGPFSLCLLQSNAVSDELALKSGVRQDCVSTVHTDSTRTAFHSLGRNSSKGEMQENDLFKAEFILITDSGDEDEAAAASNNVHRPSNGYGPISAQLLATSHVSPGTGAGKPTGDGFTGAALSHSAADPQKHQVTHSLNSRANLCFLKLSGRGP